MRPISTVEKPSFIALVEGLSGVKPMCSKTLQKHVTSRACEIKLKLNELLSKQKYYCTTADIWTANRKSYMGITVHYIDCITFERKSFLLGIRRIKFAHTFKEIGKCLMVCFNDFKLDESKLVGTVTDNASNFAKAFRVFSKDMGIELLENNNSTDEPVSDNIDDNFEIHEINLDLDYSNVMVDNVDDEKEDTDDEINLPKQYRCCSHTLNLIATSDAEKAKSNLTYKRAYNSAFSKLIGFWNTLSRSSKQSDILYDICGKKLPSPCPTRWNSTYDSVKELMMVGREKINQVMEKMDKVKLKLSDFDFLNEYLLVMKPLADALDLLQGEKKCFLGYVLPTLFGILVNLKKLNNLNYCNQLKTEISNGINKRFTKILNLNDDESHPYVLASMSMPNVKLKWVNFSWVNEIETEIYEERLTAEKLELCKKIFRNELVRVSSYIHANTNNEGDTSEVMNSSNDCGLLSFMDSSSLSKRNGSAYNQVEIEMAKYLEDDSCELPSLNKYEMVKDVFLKFNTILPSSAPVERIFSFGGIMLNPRRNRMTDENFENQMICKINYDLL